MAAAGLCRSEGNPDKRLGMADSFNLQRFGRACLTTVRNHRMALRARGALSRSRLFDARWYRATHDLPPDSDPLTHCLTNPALRPSPWFDAEWYLQRYPDVTGSALHPLAHFILFGAAERRDPNPVFATEWYLAEHPEAASSLTPLDHYLQFGVSTFLDPAPAFDAAWYAATHMRDADAGLDPLGHYLLVGRGAGARTEPASRAARGEPVEAAWLDAFKPFGRAAARHVALVAARSRQGRLSAPDEALVRRLAAAGVAVVLIAEGDDGFDPGAEITNLLAGGYVREPRGHAFDAWAHLMRAEPWLFAGEALLLLSGEHCADLEAPAVAELLATVERSSADVLATPAQRRGGRLASHLLVLKGRALSSPAVHGFFGDLTSAALPEPAARREFEAAFSASMRTSGLEVELLEAAAFAASASSPAPPGDALPAIAAAKAARRPGAAQGRIQAAPVRPISDEPLKVAFIGPWNFATGLSQASRGYISALWRTGLRLNLHPVETAFHVHKRVTPTVTARDFEGAADIAIVHLNPDAWGALTVRQREVIKRAKVRIGLWVWEMGHVPDSWRAEFASVDEIWTPSRYCAEVFTGQSPRPVSVVPHVVPVPAAAGGQDRTAALSAFGLEPDARVILYVFDGASFIERKNPQALIRAFAASGLARQGWRLLLKTKNLMDQPRHGAALTALAASTEGVRLVEAQLDQEGLNALFDLADIYASPHRSEGFGLTVAEAMARGKHVVASDFGGVRDFLDADCGFPVPVRIVQLDEELGAYPKGGYWGEVDEAALAAALAEAAQQIDSGDYRIAERARERIAERLSPEAVARAICGALEAAVSRRQQEQAA